MVKLEARVVILKNFNPKLVNGLCGTVKSFIDGFACVYFDNGEVEVIQQELFTVERESVVIASRKQIPLHLAYAMTIHKSQGMSFDFLEVDVTQVFKPGQAYVASKDYSGFTNNRMSCETTYSTTTCQGILFQWYCKC